MDLFERSDKVTHCPYKGDATYFHVAGVDDAAWSYEKPLPEADAIRGLVCFEDGRVTVEHNIPPAAM